MAASKKRSPRLGRGLSSLMSSPVQVQPPAEEVIDRGVEPQNPDAAGGQTTPGDPGETARGPSANTAALARQPPAVADGQLGLTYVPVERLKPNRHQPRQRFDDSGLKGLADSIKAEGVMQPIVVRPTGAGREGYEIVAGERRWRAAQLAGLTKIPAIVRDLSDRQLAEWALIENLQREDLNPIERAEAFSKLIEQFGLSHEEAGLRVGMDRSSISNHLRLLGLIEPVKQLIRENLLSMGQARALAGLSDVGQQKMLAERAVREGMSVREVESAVRRLTQGDSQTSRVSRRSNSPYLADLEKQIAEQLGTKVHIRAGRKKGAGTMSIEFYSLDQFDALVGRLGVHTD
jgi:ParB family transcriptional regulator, chromosome partitioning protein